MGTRVAKLSYDPRVMLVLGLLCSPHNSIHLKITVILPSSTFTPDTLTITATLTLSPSPPLLTCKANVTDSPARPGEMVSRDITANRAANSIREPPSDSMKIANALQGKET